MKLKLVKISEADEKIKKRIDSFILSNSTNGEFINSVQYLLYHPKNRFEDDSIIVIDSGNLEVKSVLMAASVPGNSREIISHPGTTFAGPILDERTDIEMGRQILDIMLSYYEEKYDKVEIRLRPGIYDNQPMDWLQYLLMRRNYNYNMMALANVVNLREVEEGKILEFFNSSRRNHIKKVLKNEKYRVKSTSVPEKRIWNSLNQNLKEKFDSSTTHSYDEIINLSQMMPERIKAYSAEREDGNYGAFVLGFCYKKVFHTQYLDLNYQYSSEYPHLYLIFKLIEMAKKKGYSYFSFGASTENRGQILNEGLFQYKNGYGGGAVLLPAMTWLKEV